MYFSRWTCRLTALLVLWWQLEPFVCLLVVRPIGPFFDLVDIIITLYRAMLFVTNHTASYNLQNFPIYRYIEILKDLSGVFCDSLEAFCSKSEYRRPCSRKTYTKESGMCLWGY